MLSRIFFLLLLINSFLFSQQFNFQKQLLLKGSTFSNKLNIDILSSYKISADIIQNSLNFNQTEIIYLGSILLVAGTALEYEKDLRTRVLKSKNYTMNKITLIGEKFGSGYYGGPISVLLYMGGYLFSDEKYIKTGQMLLEGMISNALITQSLKIIIGRERPFVNGNNSKIDFLEIRSKRNSMPSGHTSMAFTYATILSSRFDNIFASIGFYSLATLAAYQRIYSDAHWLSDVILGASLGTFIGLKIVKHHDSDSIEDSFFDLRIIPKISLNNIGVGLLLQF